jgi:hypothetical protein
MIVLARIGNILRVRANEFRMGFVRQPFGLSDREKGLFDLKAGAARKGLTLFPANCSLSNEFSEAASRVVGTGVGATRFIDGPQP